MERRGYLAVRYAALIVDLDPYEVLHAIRRGELSAVHDASADPLDGQYILWDDFLKWLCCATEEAESLHASGSFLPDD